MGRENSSYKPVSGRNMPQQVNPEQPHNHADTQFQALCVDFPQPAGYFQPFQFDPALPVELVVFTHEYPTDTQFYSDYGDSDEASGRRSFPERLFAVDSDSGELLFGGSQIIVPDEFGLGRRQHMLGKTVTHNVVVNGYYLVGFLDDRGLTSGGEPIPCSMHGTVTCAGPQIEGPQPLWIVGDQEGLEYWQTILLWEPLYTPEIKAAGNVFTVPDAFYGNDWFKVVGVFGQVGSGEAARSGDGEKTPEDYWRHHPLYLHRGK